MIARPIRMILRCSLRKAVAGGAFTTSYMNFAPRLLRLGGTNLWLRIEGNGMRIALVPVDAAPKIATGGNDPAFEQWVKSTAALPPQQQLDAFSKKMIELNPGFDGKLRGYYGEGATEDRRKRCHQRGI